MKKCSGECLSLWYPPHEEIIYEVEECPIKKWVKKYIDISTLFSNCIDDICEVLEYKDKYPISKIKCNKIKKILSNYKIKQRQYFFKKK